MKYEKFKFSKKTMAFLVVAALAAVVALAGCSGSQGASGSEQKPDSAAPAATSAPASTAPADTSAQPAAPAAPADTSAQPTAPAADQAAPSAPAAASSADGYIGDDAAKAIALKDAGLAEADVTELKAELDLDDAVVHYDVDFKAGGLEYDYDIDATTGDILTSKSEVDD